MRVNKNAFPYQFFCNICEMIIENPKFVSEISYFGYYYHSSLLNNELLKAFLSSLPSSIKHISFSTTNAEVHKHFANKMQLSSTIFRPSISMLDSLKHSSNTYFLFVFLC